MTNVALPLQFDHRGRTSERDEDRYLRDLVEAVLFTAPGERVMRPDFGCGVEQLLFEPNSPELAGTVEMLVQGALTQWLGELVTVGGVRVEAEESVLRVSVSYAQRSGGGQQVRTFTFGATP
jgi:phage baseplate assembly protein W